MYAIPIVSCCIIIYYGTFLKSDLWCSFRQGWWVLLWCAIFRSKFFSCRRFLVLFNPLVIYRLRFISCDMEIIISSNIHYVHRPILLPTPNIYKAAINATFKRKTRIVSFHIKRIWNGRLWCRHIALCSIVIITNIDRLWMTEDLCDSIQHADI